MCMPVPAGLSGDRAAPHTLPRAPAATCRQATQISRPFAHTKGKNTATGSASRAAPASSRPSNATILTEKPLHTRRPDPSLTQSSRKPVPRLPVPGIARPDHRGPRAAAPHPFNLSTHHSNLSSKSQPWDRLSSRSADHEASPHAQCPTAAVRPSRARAPSPTKPVPLPKIPQHGSPAGVMVKRTHWRLHPGTSRLNRHRAA